MIINKHDNVRVSLNNYYMKTNNRSATWYEKFRKFRLEAGLSQVSLAKKMRKSEITIHRIEKNGYGNFSGDDLKRLARLLKISLDDIFLSK